MKKIRKYIAFILFVTLTVSSTCITALSANDVLSYELNEDKKSYTLSACSTLAAYELEIPSTHNSLPVTAIGEKAFYNCEKIYKITIGANVANIGNGAFYGCSSLSEIDIEGDNFVETDGAIYTSDMKTLVYVIDRNTEAFALDSRTESINGYCFSGMTKLVEVDLKNVSRLGSHCFADCTSLSLLTVPTTLDEYPEYLFSGCTSLLAASVEPTVKKIGAGCFFNCESLRSVLVPNDIYVGENAFWGCDGVTVYCNSKSSCDTVARRCGVKVENISFTGQRRVKSIVINPIRSLSVGEKREINSGLVGDNIEVRYCFYVSSNPDVIEISDKIMSAKKEGKATIYAYSVDGLKIDSREAEVVKQNALLESEHNYLDNSDETKTYTLSGKPSKILITFSEQTYTEQDEDFIFITDGDGESYGAYSGSELSGKSLIINSDTVNIRLTSDENVNYYGYSIVSVVNADDIAFPEKITLSQDTLELRIGEEKKIDVEISPTDAYYGKIYYRISDSSVASVDSEGKISGIGGGETYLTVFSKYGDATAQCKIKVIDNSYNGFVYEISNGEAEIIYYKGNETNITIPEKINNYPTTKIASYAFAFNGSIKSVSIPSSIKAISPFAFAGCSSLESFEVSAKNTYYKSVDGDIQTYDGSCLVCVKGATDGAYVIPDEIKTILCGAVGYNCGITAVTLGELTENIETGAFEGCSSLVAFKVNAKNKHYCAVNDSLYSYDKKSFVLCPTAKSGEIIVSNNTEKISANAFYKCESINKITLPKSVKVIDGTAFCCASALTEISIDTSNPNYKSDNGCIYTSDLKTLVCVPCGKNGGYSVMESVEVIGEYAFANSSLSNVNLPYNLKRISAYAFCGADSLSSIVLTPYVESLAEHCFDNCSGIVIYAPNGIKSVGENSFDGKFYCAEGSETEQSLIKAGIEPLNCTYCCSDEYMLIAFSIEPNLKNGSSMNVNAFSDGENDIFNVKFSYDGEIYIPRGYVNFKLCHECDDELKVWLDDGTRFSSNDSWIEFISDTNMFYVSPSSLEVILPGLKIKTMPKKTEYIFGQELDTDGLSLYYLSPDGKVTVITDGYTAECGLDKNGENTVYVSYLNALTEYSVNVSAPQFECEATLSGGNTVGSSLSLGISNITPVGMKYEIYWYRNGVVIDGENNKTYKVTVDDMGKTICAVVKAGNGFEGSITSNEIYIEITEISSEIYCVNKNSSIISKISLQTNVKDFVASLSPNEFLTVKKGTVTVSDSSYVGTGMAVELVVGGVTYQKLNIVVTGDINGDGKTTVTDFVKLKTRIMSQTQFDGVGEKGADVNGDGKITITDFVQMKTHILGNGKIIAKEAK